MLSNTWMCAVIVAAFILFAEQTALGGEAAADAKWLADKARIEELSKSENCEQYWDVLWPWAKAGNVEARMYLLTFMAPPPHGTMILAPGNSGDLASRVRDIVVMAVHSHAYEGKADFNKYYKDLARDFYVRQGFEETTEGQEFLKCIDNDAHNCADIAVKGRLVPSFEDYAAQVDMFSQSGSRSSCVSASDNK